MCTHQRAYTACMPMLQKSCKHNIIIHPDTNRYAHSQKVQPYHAASNLIVAQPQVGAFSRISIMLFRRTLFLGYFILCTCAYFTLKCILFIHMYIYEENDISKMILNHCTVYTYTSICFCGLFYAHTTRALFLRANSVISLSL